MGTEKGSPEQLPPFAAVPPYWSEVERLARAVERGLPPTLVSLWGRSGRGVLIVMEGERARVETNLFMRRDIQAQGALFVPPEAEPQVLWETVGVWLDHFGGSFGGVGRLSDGQGATPTLKAAAARLQEALALGYSREMLESDDAGVLFARAVAAYQLELQALSAADPMLARWLRGTVFDEGFWRKVEAEGESLKDGGKRMEG